MFCLGVSRNVKYQKCKHGLEKEDLADTTYHISRGLGKLQESMKSETEKVGLCFIMLNAYIVFDNIFNCFVLFIS